MASSGNFAVFNPLANTQAGLSYSDAVYSQGNTRFRGNTGGTATTQLTHALSSGKWYIEFYVDGSPASGFPMIGIVASGTNSSTLQNTSNAPALTITSDIQLVSGEKRIFGSTSGTSYGSGFSDGDICQMAIDIDNGKVWWGKNNTFFGSGDPANGTNAGDTFTSGTEMMVFVGSYSGSAYIIVNAGQDDTFGGNETAQGNTDGNFGVFKYQPPASFLAICSGNLPISDDIDPAQTDDDYPSKQFNVITFTGTGSSRTISGLGLQPDLIWAKRRDGSRRHYLVDSNRGFTKYLHSDGAFSEGTSSDGVTSANSDGFVIGGSLDYINTSSNTYVAWAWRCNGGTTASNSSGSITSTVQANTAGGFSIITYTGNGSAGATIGHGLSAKPDFILTKRTSSEQTWGVYHSALGATKYLALNTSVASGTDSLFWNDTEPTNTLITFGTEGRVNASGQSYVAYVWHNVEGFQKFGTYEGNGNTDGTFVYTGFRPRMVFVKQIDGGAEWAVYDTARDTSNEMGNCLEWDLEASEKTHASDLTTDAIMFFSNGFKLTGGGGGRTNQSGRTFVFGAWGDASYKYNQTF